MSRGIVWGVAIGAALWVLILGIAWRFVAWAVSR